MLSSLHIKNYALIEALDLNFSSGLTIITGETGAGKSIILGALGLVLGKRADSSQLKQSTEKCIVEAEFDIANYNLKSQFNDYDLDYEPLTIIRREILPSGKSRAFVNDTPVNLSVLQTLSTHLIDIHSQHQTQDVTQDAFQFNLIDALAANQDILKQYQSAHVKYKHLQQQLTDLKAERAEAIKEQDYNAFLLEELQTAALVSGEQETLESEFETLNNVELISEHLAYANQVLNDDQLGVISNLRDLSNKLQDIAEVSPVYRELYNRIISCTIELDDVTTELVHLQDGVEANPERLEQLNTKLKNIQNLFQKHNVSTVDELLTIQDNLSQMVLKFESIDDDIVNLENQIATLTEQLQTLGLQLHNNREQAAPKLVQQLQNNLKHLGMPNAQFKISFTATNKFLSHGIDQLEFLFSANQGMPFNTLKKAASGGELSRIMLTIKAILCKYMQLPTIIFDEIDTGVSGEVSNKMADIMYIISNTMQVFAITHIPQVAAKGDTHYKVFKETDNQQTTTQVVKLAEADRVVEIAQMLSGKQVTDTAMQHAKQLLN